MVHRRRSLAREDYAGFALVLGFFALLRICIGMSRVFGF